VRANVRDGLAAVRLSMWGEAGTSGPFTRVQWGVVAIDGWREMYSEDVRPKVTQGRELGGAPADGVAWRIEPFAGVVDEALGAHRPYSINSCPPIEKVTAQRLADRSWSLVLY